MMNYEMFKGIIESELGNFLGDEYKDMKVVVKPTYKVNEIKDTVTLIDTKTNVTQTISPALYLEDMFSLYKGCENLPIVMNTIVDRINKAMVLAPELLMKVDYENSKDKIIWQIINADQNKELLAECPHRKINDLAVIYRVIVEENENGVFSSIINNNAAKVIGISEQELFEFASENTQRMYPVEVQDMNEMMRELFAADGMPEEVIDSMLEEMQPNSGMFVITNSRRVNGAVSMLYVDKLDELAEKLGEDLYIIPSSIHEVLAIPVSMMEPEMLKDMVYTINMNQVALEDRLSNQVYFFDKNAKTLTPAIEGPVKGIADDITDKVAEHGMEYETKPVRK